MKSFWTRCAHGMLSLFLLASSYGCSDPKSEAEARAYALAMSKETDTFKKTQPFTLRCSGQYTLTVDGKTSSGTQSFNIAFNPQRFVAYYFEFDANGFYDSWQRAHNNEVLAISSVDSDWIYVEGYKFNRSTLKYSFHGDLVGGLCEKSDKNLEIPERKI